jgi:hypothetical protein
VLQSNATDATKFVCFFFLFVRPTLGLKLECEKHGIHSFGIQAGGPGAVRLRAAGLGTGSTVRTARSAVGLCGCGRLELEATDFAKNVGSLHRVCTVSCRFPALFEHVFAGK